MASNPSAANVFDFMIGEWDAVVSLRNSSMKLTGRWEAKYLYEGRLLLDQLQVADETNSFVRSMATLRTWVPDTGEWVATFLYANEVPQYVDLRGHHEADEIRLLARDLATDEKADVRFFDIGADSFVWEQRNHGRDAGDEADISIACTRVGS